MPTYTVQPGDTLWLIASRLGTTVDAIARANNIANPNLITVGQVLNIPEVTPPAGQVYTVRPGDTIWLIATRFGVTPQAIISANQLTRPDLIHPGQQLVIPVPPVPPGGQVYIVQPGDSVWGIARRFGVTPQAIISANQLASPNLIYPGQRLVIPPPAPPPAPPKPQARVLGYYVGFDPTGTAHEMFVRHRDQITDLALFQYRVRSDLTIDGPAAPPVLSEAHAAGVKVLPVITNWNVEQFRFDQELAHTILNDATQRATLADNIVKLVQGNGFDGIHLDFEDVPPGDRQVYTTFAQELARRLKPLGKILSIAVMAKTADLPTTPWAGFFDYSALGAVADFLVLMTYDYHWAGGDPGPIAPVPWMKAVLTYALSVIPADKILLGIPLYGYDWTLPIQPGRWAEIIAYEPAVRLAAGTNATVQWDGTALEPFFDYTVDTVQHTVYFQSPDSLGPKLDVALQGKIAGIAIWSLSESFDGFYDLVTSRFQVVR